MEYNLKDLLNIEEVQLLLEKFNKIINLPHGIYDLEGNLLAGSGWQDICMKFHRLNKKAISRCSESDSSKFSGKDIHIYKCANGLTKAITPIFIKDKHMGNFVIAQFFTEKPNIDYFKRQAKELGFNEIEYIKAINKLVVISKEKVKDILEYFNCLGTVLARIAINRTKEIEEKKNEIKKVKDELEKSEYRYKILIDMIPDAIFVRNKENISYCNKAALKQLGLKNPREAIGKNIKEFIKSKDNDNENFENNLKMSIDGNGFPLSEEVIVRKSDDKIMYVETLGVKISDFGNNEIIIVSRDISDRKKAEKLNIQVKQKEKKILESKEYEKIRTDFFANLSHEFRTPLNIILTSLKMCECKRKKVVDYNFFNEKYKYCSLIKQNTYRLIRLVNNFIDIIKLDAGYFKLQLTNVDIVNLVENITISIVKYANKKNIDVVFDTNVEEFSIACDKNQVETIMLNLLSNAIKFTKVNGKIDVNLKVDEKFVWVSVSDTGIGIPSENKQVIFRKFVQVDKSLSRLNEGSGIGLSLVKALIEMHNGSIKVESEKEKGSCFTLKIPNRLVEIEDVTENRNLNNKNIEEKVDIEFSDIYFS